MNTYIALFRGINVGGNNSLPMKELVTILEDTGARKIKTYIQSGNAVFQSAEKHPSQLPKKLATMADEERDFNDRDNILIADQFNNCVIEIERRTHKIVWQFGNSSDKPGPSRALSH